MGTGIAKMSGNDLQKMDKPGLIAKVEELQRSVANLGDGQVFVKRTPEGIIRACKAVVALREDLGEIQTVGTKTMPTVPGVYKLNQTPGLNIATPPCMIFEGKEVSNPHIEKHPVTKTPKVIHVRKVVFGFNPVGKMCGVEYTLYYNVYTYFIQDLFKKISKFPACGRLGKKTEGIDPKNPTRGEWNFYEIEDSGSDKVGMWVDLTHKEIISCFKQLSQRQQYADRNAQSICTRNALLRHPSIAAVSVLTQGGSGQRIAKIPVFSFMHNLGKEEISKIAAEISSTGTVSGEIDMTRVVGEAEYEEVNTAQETEGGEFSTPPEPVEGEDIPIDLAKPDTGEKEDKGNPSKEREALSEAIWEFRESKGDTLFFAKLDEFKKSKKKKSIKWPDGYNNDDLAEVLALFGKGEK